MPIRLLTGSPGLFLPFFWLLRRAEGFLYIFLLLPGVPLVPTIRGTSVCNSISSFTRSIGKGGLYASLYDGIQTTMHVCKCFCNPHIPFLLPMESLYSSGFIWLLYVLSSLTLLGSEVHQSLCEFCPTVWLPFWDSWVSFGSTCSGFHMNLLIPGGHMDLFAFFALWGGGSLRFSFHCLGTTLVNQAQGANWGCSLWEVVATSICSNI